MLKDELMALNGNEEKEARVVSMAYEYIHHSNFVALKDLLTSLQDDWPELTTARLTKIIRRIFEHIPISADSYKGMLDMLDGLIEWAENKKTLKIELQCKQIHVFLNVRMYSECLEKISEIIPELKKYDDRINIISVHVYESRAYYEIKDFPRAKSVLTSARALSVSTPCPAHLQAQIDLLNGMYLSDEGAHETAQAYFIESIEGFVQDKMYENAKVVLRYIILGKMMIDKNDEASQILETKYATKIKDDSYVSLLIDAGKACKKRNLCMFRKILQQNTELVNSDEYIYRHLQALYNLLLDRNILKLIEPYSHVKIRFIAERLDFTEDIIEDKLRKMILDGTIRGILDHVTQCLIVFPPEEKKGYDSMRDINAILEAVSYK